MKWEDVIILVFTASMVSLCFVVAWQLSSSPKINEVSLNKPERIQKPSEPYKPHKIYKVRNATILKVWEAPPSKAYDAFMLLSDGSKWAIWADCWAYILQHPNETVTNETVSIFKYEGDWSIFPYYAEFEGGAIFKVI